MATQNITLDADWQQLAVVDEFVLLQADGNFFYIYNSSTPGSTDKGYLAEIDSSMGYAVAAGYALDTFWAKSVDGTDIPAILTIGS